ncbi:ATP-binding cassette domain-containing protein [Candidatus Roizmanbacteria bacterium]|nr:ATP-binding cassette domain-containing protein [Candidatus Roizmanbacteria bacterium]
MLEFRKVTKKYPGNRMVLDNASFVIQPGEFVYLVGPSGAGKTTILRLLIGEMKPTAGKILYREHPIQKFSRRQTAYLRREVRIVFQDFKVLYDRTVLENVLLSLYILGRKQQEAIAEARKVLKLVGLDDKRNMFPIQISAGELQRVAIARAIAGDSKVLLADEPTGNLDPDTGNEIMKLLDEINSTGTTVIVTTHNEALVNQAKKRVIEVQNGTIVRDEREGGYRAS